MQVRELLVMDTLSTARASELLDKIIARLPETTVLPQSRLEELMHRGIIMSVMTFDEFMSPEVHWIEPEEFGRAFDELVASGADTRTDQELDEAADQKHEARMMDLTPEEDHEP